MELAAVVVGAVATVAAAKLSTVIDKKVLRGEQAMADARYMKGELDLIDEFIELYYADKGQSGHGNLSEEKYVAKLRSLAYEIEDCTDSFKAKKTSVKQFADEISKLRHTSVDEREQMTSFLHLKNAFSCGTQNIADEEISRKKRFAGTAQDAVPKILQDLLNNGTSESRLVVDCLVYFCLFPPNYDVSIKTLMRRWVAEGLVQEEDKAIENLRSFIESSIITSTQIINNGEDVETCRPTSQMHACISQKSQSQNFILVCDSMAKAQKQEVRRLTVHPSATVQLKFPQKISHLRTLAVIPAAANESSLVPGAAADDDDNVVPGVGASAADDNDDNVVPGAAAAAAAKKAAAHESLLDFSRYGLLRVLDLKERGPLSKEQLDNILIKHPQLLMKYLSINLGSINRIKRGIGHLLQLETLDLSGSQTVTVFKEVLRLPILKHLLGKFRLSNIDTKWLIMLGLKRFLRKDSMLETLEGFVTSKGKGFPQLMSYMKSLRKVKIWFTPNASKNNLGVASAAITKFIREGTDQADVRRSLSLHFEEGSGEFANEIKAVAGNLESLKVCGTLSQFPPFVRGTRLVIEEICLCSTGLRWKDIAVGLSHLTGLKYLLLIEDALDSLDMLIAERYLRSVKRLRVVCTQRLKIAITAVALPNVQSVQIICQYLSGIRNNLLIEITDDMKYLKEVALHHDLDDTIMSALQELANTHPNRPTVLLLE